MLPMNDTNKDARELISFYLDAGVNALIGEQAVDRFADEAPRLRGPLRNDPPPHPSPAKGQSARFRNPLRRLRPRLPS
jgi:hypothetical protein